VLPSLGSLAENRESMEKFLREQDGQVLVEYILMLAFVVTIVTLMSTSLKSSLFKMWNFYGKMIAAPCPGCATDVQIQRR